MIRSTPKKTKKISKARPPRLRVVISQAAGGEPMIFDIHTKRRLTPERLRLAMEAFKERLISKGARP
jgi:hypothetical protein